MNDIGTERDRFQAACRLVLSLGGDDARREYGQFENALIAVLSSPRNEVADHVLLRAAVEHAAAYYYWSWDARGVQLLPMLQVALETWGSAAVPNLELLCILTDLLFFLAWCFSDSSTEQCHRILPGFRVAAAALARTRQQPDTPRRPRDPSTPVHIGFLGMFCDSANAMAVGLRHFAPAVLAAPDRFRLTVFAWRFTDTAFLGWLREQGVRCHVTEWVSALDSVQAIEALAASDPIDIAVTDNNNAVPTALFARNLAPLQILLQSGMPAWPVRPLHAVFNSFGFDPAVADWGNARMLSFNPPWDISKLAPAIDADNIAQERARLPTSLRLIGSYGRLVKVSEACLKAAEQIVLQCPDCAFVVGGTGDPSHIENFIANSPARDRMHVVARHVPGHVWGHFLDVFLDTWPVTGGESCREMIAKHRPVITMHSDEMPAIDHQRDPALVARTWDDYVTMAVALLNDHPAHQDACDRAAALATRMADRTGFTRQMHADLNMLVDGDRASGWRGRMAAFVKTWRGTSHR